MINPLPPPFKPTDAFPTFKNFAECFQQADWRTEEGTKKGVERMEEAMKGLLMYYPVEIVEVQFPTKVDIGSRPPAPSLPQV